MVYYTVVRRDSNSRAAKDAAKAAGFSLLLPLFGLDGNTPLMKDESGRPFLEGAPKMGISCSHAYPFTVVAISNRPVGVDLETEAAIRDPERLSARFFTEEEQRALAISNDKRLTALSVWTRKEAMGKYYGDGLAAHISACTSKPPKETAFYEEQWVHENCRYILTFCAHESPSLVSFFEK